MKKNDENNESIEKNIEEMVINEVEHENWEKNSKYRN